MHHAEASPGTVVTSFCNIFTFPSNITDKVCLKATMQMYSKLTTANPQRSHGKRSYKYLRIPHLQMFIRILTYVPYNAYNLIFRPTNAQYILTFRHRASSILGTGVSLLSRERFLYI